MTYIEQWMRKNKMTRQQTADELEMSKSAIDKMASGKNNLRRVVKYALLWIEHKKISL